MKHFISVLILVFSGYSNLLGQHIIHGVVVDAQENRVSGASIHIKGSELSSLTNEDGGFALVSPSPAGELIVTHVGYQKLEYSFSVPDQPLRLVLTEITNELDEVEVVHTGYQSLPKERSTGSFVTISEEILDQGISTSLLERLEGYMPGLQFETRSGNQDIHIRGLSTINLTMGQPLIVLDNFPYEGDLNNINPADIESVTVLRDAAATSIWGARAGNGVIVITRKKAKGDRIAVNYRVSSQMSEKPRLLDVPVMSSKEFIDVERFLFEKGFYNNLLDPNTNRQTFISPVVHMLDRHKQNMLSDAELEEFIDMASRIDYRKQMNDHIFRTPSVIQQSLGFGGNLNGLAYRTSIGYDHSNLEMKSEKSRRVTLSQNLSYTIKDRISINLSLDLTSSSKSSPNSVAYPLRTGGGRAELYPYVALVDENGVPMPVPRTYNPYYLQRFESSGLLDWTYNPIVDMDRASTDVKSNHSLVGINVGYKIRDGIDFNIFYSNEQQKGYSETFYEEDAYFVRDLVNRFTQVEEDGYSYPLPMGGIQNITNRWLLAHRGRATLKIDKRWADMHNLNVMMGTDLSSSLTNSNSNRHYGVDVRTLNTTPVDYNTPFVTFDRIHGSQRIPYSASISGLNNRYVSLYTNFSYTLLSKYILTGSARRDASNIFGVNTNRKWNPLWSVGMAWSVLDESWVNIGWLDQLKIRSTYGHSGNAGGIASSLPVLANISYSSSWLTNFPRMQIRTLPNADLRWENVRMYNLGMDFRLLKGRLWGSFEYFSKYSTDLLANDIIDPTLGFSTMTKNIGEMKGRGFDAQLNVRFGHDRFSWIGSAFLSSSRNEIVKYYGASSMASYYTENAGTAMRPVEGKSAYPVFAHRFAGLDPENGNPVGYLDNEESVDYRAIQRDSIQNLRYFGTSMAPYFGSFRNVLRWKEFELSALLSFKFGAYKQRPTIKYFTLYNSWSTHSDYQRRWQQPGDEAHTTVPSLNYPADTNRDNFYAQSEVNIFNASYVRLQDIRLSYDWPVGGDRSKGSVKLFGVANQIGLLWTSNAEGIDPENHPIPRSRTYSVGISWNY